MLNMMCKLPFLHICDDVQTVPIAVCTRVRTLMIKQPPQICYGFYYTQNARTQNRQWLT